MKKYYQICLFAACCLFCVAAGLPGQASAQQVPEPEIRAPEKGTRMWTGTATLFRDTYYRYTGNPDSGLELERRAQTQLELEFRNLRFINPVVSAGWQGLGQIYMDGTFGNIGLGAAALGPLVRAYPFSQRDGQHWQLYTQAGFLAGANLALGDAYGANAGEGARYRTGLRAGVTHRISNAFGIYLETGPDWEADEQFDFDSQAWQFEVGIQLFRFK